LNFDVLLLSCYIDSLFKLLTNPVDNSVDKRFSIDLNAGFYYGFVTLFIF